MSFYQDLGVKEIYRRKAAAAGAVPMKLCKVFRNSAARPRRRHARQNPARIWAIASAAACAKPAPRSSSAPADENARLVFVGEGPGADEDAQGFPFVGRAGQLLTQMIDNTASKEGIPIRRPGCVHLQRGEVPPAGESHAAAG